MTTTPITERLRSRHLLTAGAGVAELCEEAARTIEALRERVVLLSQESEYLAAGALVRSSEWENDT